MNWKNLAVESQLEEIINESNIAPLVIFKHSTSCPVSADAKHRLEQSIHAPLITFYYLDLLAHRRLSNLIAEKFEVRHESPQVLLIKDGTCIYNASHGNVQMQGIVDRL